MKITFVGGGNMAEAMLAGILRAKFSSPQDLAVCDISIKRCSYLHQTYDVSTISTISEGIKEADLVVLAIKPGDLSPVMKELKGRLHPYQIALSVVAGASLSTLTEGLRHDVVVRVMPNINARVGEAMSLWTATPKTTSEQKEKARSLLGALGKEIYVEDEKLLDLATAVSGCGPAYVFLFIEALTDAGVHIGLPRELAQEIVLQTFVGSARMAQIFGRHPAELRSLVTSPGGATVEALLRLEEAGIRGIIIKAIIAAYEKIKRLEKIT